MKIGRILIIIFLLFAIGVGITIYETCFGDNVETIDTSLYENHKTTIDTSAKPVQRITIFNNTANEGIDISKYQRNINWDKIAANKRYGFVYVRSSYGCKIKDQYYARNIEEAHKHYIPVGTYHYYLNSQTPQKQFEFFMSMVDKDKQDLIPMIDVEEESHGKSIRWNAKRLKEFLSLVETEFGVKPIIYTNVRYYNMYLSKEFSDYPLWIASYTRKVGKLKKNKQYIIWQYSAKGRIKGIPGYIDRDRLNPDITIKDLLISNAAESKIYDF